VIEVGIFPKRRLQGRYRVWLPLVGRWTGVLTGIAVILIVSGCSVIHRHGGGPTSVASPSSLTPQSPATAVPGLVTTPPEPSVTTVAPTVPPEIQAEAIAKPSIVYIETSWKGWVLIPENNVGIKAEWVGPYKATTTCSGFVANSSGYIVTAGHCVDNQSMTYGGKKAIIDIMLRDAIDHNLMTGSQAAQLMHDIVTNGLVQARPNGSTPMRSIIVRLPSGRSNPAPTGLNAQVVDFRSFQDGDVALLNVQSQEPMPALQVADQTPDDGTEVVAAGYPASVGEVVGPEQAPSFKTGTVSSTQILRGVPVIEISAPTSPGMSGGPAFDMQGRALGTVSFFPTGERQPFNFITDTDTLKALLSDNGIPTGLSAADQAYRAGVTDYYAGRYSDAVVDFNKVLAVEPSNATARDFRFYALARSQESSPS
jgi:serine protease Do